MMRQQIDTLQASLAKVERQLHSGLPVQPFGHEQREADLRKQVEVLTAALPASSSIPERGVLPAATAHRQPGQAHEDPHPQRQEGLQERVALSAPPEELPSAAVHVATSPGQQVPLPGAPAPDQLPQQQQRAQLSNSHSSSSPQQASNAVVDVALPEGATKHFFLSHSQATGGDQSNALYLELERMGLKCWVRHCCCCSARLSHKRPNTLHGTTPDSGLPLSVPVCARPRSAV